MFMHKTLRRQDQKKPFVKPDKKQQKKRGNPSFVYFSTNYIHFRTSCPCAAGNSAYFFVPFLQESLCQRRKKVGLNQWIYREIYFVSAKS